MMGYDADSVKIWERLAFNKYLGTSLILGQSDTLDYFLNNSEKGQDLHSWQTQNRQVRKMQV